MSVPAVCCLFTTAMLSKPFLRNVFVPVVVKMWTVWYGVQKRGWLGAPEDWVGDTLVLLGLSHTGSCWSVCRGKLIRCNRTSVHNPMGWGCLCRVTLPSGVKRVLQVSAICMLGCVRCCLLPPHQERPSRGTTSISVSRQDLECSDGSLFCSRLLSAQPQRLPGDSRSLGLPRGPVLT